MARKSALSVIPTDCRIGIVPLEPLHHVVNDLLSDGVLLRLFDLCNYVKIVFSLSFQLLLYLFDHFVIFVLLILLVVLLEHLGVQKPETDQRVVDEGLHDCEQ